MAKKMQSVEGLCVHHTAGSQEDTVESIRKYHKQHGYADIAYHFVLAIDKHGRGHLKRGRPDTMAGCHGSNYHNAHYLGFVVPGNYSKIRMSEELYGDLLAAVKHVMELYKIPADKVIGHREVKNTACPGDFFPMDRLKRDIV